MMNIKDTLSNHRSEGAAQRQLAHELADYTSAADRLEIETIAARYSEEDSREVRQILFRLAA